MPELGEWRSSQTAQAAMDVFTHGYKKVPSYVKAVHSMARTNEPFKADVGAKETHAMFEAVMDQVKDENFNMPV